MTKTVAILGGGIAGLSAAEAIGRRCPETKVRVLEAAAVPGGKITTRSVGGFVVETGPHGFLDKEPKAMALVERLGLTSKLVKADEASANRFVVRQGKLRKLPSSPPAFLGSDVLPFGARMRVLTEPFRKKGALDEESVWDFAARRMGPQAADVLIDAFVTGIYGGDPKTLSVQAAFPRLAEIESKYGSLIKGQIAIAKEKKRNGQTSGGAAGPGGTLHSFGAGLGLMIDALSENVDIACGFRAQTVTKTDSGFVVRCDQGEVTASAVVCTLPTFEAARLFRPFAETQASLLENIPYVPVAVVVHGYPQAALTGRLDGFGFLVPHQEQRKILGSIWASTVFAGHAPDGTIMLRTLMGGARRPECAEGDDETLIERARSELVGLMGLSNEVQPVLTEVIRWPKAIPQYTIGHLTRAAAADEIEKVVPGAFFGGNGLRGVAMIQTIADADRIAERVAGFLS